MKNLKSILQIIMILSFMVMAEPMMAQSPQGVESSGGKAGGKGERRQEMKQKMDEIEAKLNLTPEQAAKVEEIKTRTREEAKGKVMALPVDAPREEKAKIMKQAMANADSEIMELLNTEQQAIYKAEIAKMKAENKEKRMERKKAKGK